MATGAFAQDAPARPRILPDTYGQRLTPDGEIMTGQTNNGSALVYNRITDEGTPYWDVSPGNGNHYSQKYDILVGSSADESHGSTFAVICKGGKKIYPKTLEKYTLSSLHGITPDATRVCGLVEDLERSNKNHQMYQPVFIPIDGDGNVGEPYFLPIPEKDFFGTYPQYCSAVWISEDGHKILGYVVDDSGFYVYPILYTEDAQGDWTYSFPSESMFNPNHLDIPQNPGDFEEMFPGLDAPDVTNFMTPEERKEWDAAIDAWEKSQFDPDLDPYGSIEIFMTKEEIDAYNAYVDKYNAAVIEYNEKSDYYHAMLEVVLDDSVLFLQNAFTMNLDGTLMGGASLKIDYTGSWMPEETYTPYMFDLTSNELSLDNGSIKKLESEHNKLIPRQILADGTVICIAPMANYYSIDLTPVKSYVANPGETRLMPIEDFLETKQPALALWMNDFLQREVIVNTDENGVPVYDDVLVSGYVSMSDDFSVVIGGVEGYTFNYIYDYFTYVYPSSAAGVESVADSAPEGYKVFNLNGVNILNTQNKEDLKNLPKGIYIVNGKKTAI